MRLLTRLWSFLLADEPSLLDGPEYYHFREIVIPTARGTTEIDHLIVSRFGVFVVQLKNRSGWIFGNVYNPTWTAVHHGEKFRFQNPLHQNYGHIKGLQEFLGVDKRVLYGIVVFRGSFEFKTLIPEGVLCHRYDEWIAAKKDVILDDAAVEAIVRSLETNAFRGSRASLWHTRSIRERFASDSVCPKCGGALRLLMQRWGPDPGSQFLGCSNYPRCKFTKNVSNARVT